MRMLTHAIYLTTIIIVMTTTYLIGSSANQPEVSSSDIRAPSSKLSTEHEVFNESLQPDEPSLAQPVIQAVDSQDNDNTALADAQARIDQLESDLEGYLTLQSQFSELTQTMSRQAAEAQRALGRDHEWATATELDLETMFIRDEELRDMQIESLECYREHCELTLNHPHREANFPGEYFYSLLNDEARFQDDSFSFMTISEKERTELIINRRAAQNQ